MKYPYTTWLALLLALMLLPGSLLAAEDNVHVKGHWILEIYNADGSFDRRVEFDNALMSFGNNTLIRILNREISAGPWFVHLIGNGSGYESPCANGSGAATACVIMETASIQPYEFDNLVVGTDNPTVPTKLLLTGSATIAAVETNPKIIDVVTTYLGHCTSSETPNCATPSDVIQFTRKALSPGVTVQPGQIVNVTVEISFS